MITCLYFAWVRERIGCDEETLSLPSDVGNLHQFLDWLSRKSAAHAHALSDRTVLRFAINQDYATMDSPIKKGDEVAIFPPVTGG
ncbi:molybdopterin synthase sulfur carrier subunit [Iodidimonas gelatinilytica]|uniref:Molybdopterin synthase sulfur carrier subunit n=1 Tax=Iodidimonas gelatinilytica TaxID=1236966 RepID=A0A5A7N2G2_9PROT|nr:molybdopterin converting factor subunit 1 [Iodidimonas gelatinilytica]GEQ97794.1 molybdopterin synthase sulfur carrier subunit [Iodidimonas gelatinilytica]GER01256.1 molybdopterin synthase sulfur carrier subunit [Iodidimonas gelatinilytica]